MEPDDEFVFCLDYSAEECWTQVVKWAKQKFKLHKLNNWPPDAVALLEVKEFGRVDPGVFMRMIREILPFVRGSSPYMVFCIVRMVQEFAVHESSGAIINYQLTNFTSCVIDYLKKVPDSEDVKNLLGAVMDVVRLLLRRGQAQLADYLCQFLAMAGTEGTPLELTRQLMATSNQLLDPLQRAQRSAVRTQLDDQLPALLRLLVTCGDYDVQASLVECLFRLSTAPERPQLAAAWLPSEELRNAFVAITNFDPDCRLLLNAFNRRLGAERTVHSFPAESVTLAGYALEKPDDPDYHHMWVDFNEGSGAITVYCQRPVTETQPDETLWETVTVRRDDVARARLRLDRHHQLVTLTLDRPCRQLLSSGALEAFDGSEATLAFRKGHDLHTVLSRLYGATYKFQACEELASDRAQKASAAIRGVHCRPTSATSATTASSSAGGSRAASRQKASVPMSTVSSSSVARPPARHRVAVPKSSVPVLAGQRATGGGRYSPLEMSSPGRELHRQRALPPAEQPVPVSQSSGPSIIEPTPLPATSLSGPSTPGVSSTAQACVRTPKSRSRTGGSSPSDARTVSTSGGRCSAGGSAEQRVVRGRSHDVGASIDSEAQRGTRHQQLSEEEDQLDAQVDIGSQAWAEHGSEILEDALQVEKEKRLREDKKELGEIQEESEPEAEQASRELHQKDDTDDEADVREIQEKEQDEQQGEQAMEQEDEADRYRAQSSQRPSESRLQLSAEQRSSVDFEISLRTSEQSSAAEGSPALAAVPASTAGRGLQRAAAADRAAKQVPAANGGGKQASAADQATKQAAPADRAAEQAAAGDWASKQAPTADRAGKQPPAADRAAKQATAADQAAKASAADRAAKQAPAADRPAKQASAADRAAKQAPAADRAAKQAPAADRADKPANRSAINIESRQRGARRPRAAATRAAYVEVSESSSHGASGDGDHESQVTSPSPPRRPTATDSNNNDLASVAGDALRQRAGRGKRAREPAAKEVEVLIEEEKERLRDTAHGPRGARTKQRGSKATTTDDHTRGKQGPSRSQPEKRVKGHASVSFKEQETVRGRSKKKHSFSVAKDSSTEESPRRVQHSIFSQSDSAESEFSAPWHRHRGGGRSKKPRFPRSPHIFSDIGTSTDGENLPTLPPSPEQRGGTFKRYPVYDPRSVRNKSLLSQEECWQAAQAAQRGGRGRGRGGRGRRGGPPKRGAASKRGAVSSRGTAWTRGGVSSKRGVSQSQPFGGWAERVGREEHRLQSPEVLRDEPAPVDERALSDVDVPPAKRRPDPGLASCFGWESTGSESAALYVELSPPVPVPAAPSRASRRTCNRQRADRERTTALPEPVTSPPMAEMEPCGPPAAERCPEPLQEAAAELELSGQHELVAELELSVPAAPAALDASGTGQVSHLSVSATESAPPVACPPNSPLSARKAAQAAPAAPTAAQLGDAMQWQAVSPQRGAAPPSRDATALTATQEFRLDDHLALNEEASRPVSPVPLDLSLHATDSPLPSPICGPGANVDAVPPPAAHSSQRRSTGAVQPPPPPVEFRPPLPPPPAPDRRPPQTEPLSMTTDDIRAELSGMVADWETASVCSDQPPAQSALRQAVAAIRRQVARLDERDERLHQLGRRSAATQEKLLTQQRDAVATLEKIGEAAATARRQAAERILAECERLERPTPGQVPPRAAAGPSAATGVESELESVQRELDQLLHAGIDQLQIGWRQC